MNSLKKRESARRASVRAGVVSTVGVLALLVFAITAQNGLPDYLPGVARTQLRAEFENVGALRHGDDVRVAGVRVGFVDSIRRVGGKAVVDMRLDGGRPVFRDAKALIAARSALGQKFVDLQPGAKAAGELANGATLSLERTTTAVELDTVLDTLDADTLRATQSLLQQTGGGLAGHGTDLHDGLGSLPHVLDDLGTVSRTLAADDGQDVVALLRAADTLAGTLRAQKEDLRSSVVQVAATLEAVDVDDGAPLRTALEEAPETLTELRGALTSLDAPLDRTAAAAEALRPGAAALARATPDLRALMRAAVPPLGRVPGVARAAEPAVGRLTDTLRLADPLVSQLGTALQRAVLPLATLAPYSPEIVLFFRNVSSALQYGDAAGNWLRFGAVVNTQAVTSGLPIQDPTLKRDPYPAPGKAKDRNTSNLGGL